MNCLDIFKAENLKEHDIPSQIRQHDLTDVGRYMRSVKIPNQFDVARLYFVGV